jgi:hypothetical protein
MKGKEEYYWFHTQWLAHFHASFEGFQQGDGISVLDIGSYRQAPSDAGDFYI